MTGRALGNDVPHISVCIPAYNEEKYIGNCLESINRAADRVDCVVETIVCINRCTDRTEDIARSHAAIIVTEDAKNIAKVTNAAIKQARGEIIVTIDADSHMSPNMLSEVKRLLDAGDWIGGGALMKPERWSLGIFFTGFFLLFLLLGNRVSCGLFWFRKKDFHSLEGFDESLISAQDLDFARRLKTHGKKNGKQFKTILRAHIITSCRKFDMFGDWHILTNPVLVLKILTGRHRETANRYYYDVNR